MKALVGAFNQEKALVGAFSVIVKTDCETDGSFYSTIQSRLHLCCWHTITRDCGDCGGLSIYPGHSAPQSRGWCSLLTHRRSLSWIILEQFTCFPHYLPADEASCRPGCVSYEARPCTRANTGNKQRAQYWSGQQPSSSAALLSTKHGI